MTFNPFPTFTPFEVAAILIVLATGLGYLNYRLIGLPHTIGLTVIGAFASLLVVGVDAVLPQLPLEEAERSFLASIDFSQTLLNGMLSFLLFAGALHVDLTSLLERKWTVTILATVGVLASTALVGLGFKAVTMLLGLDVGLLWCLVFGALISPDRSGRGARHPEVRGRLPDARGQDRRREPVQRRRRRGGVRDPARRPRPATSPSRSATRASCSSSRPAAASLSASRSAASASPLMKTIDEHNLEILITLAIVMGGYALAQRLHVSGPLAMAVAGLLIGNPAVKRAMSDRTREHLLSFWSLLDEILNSVLFLIIGLEVVAIAIETEELLAGLLAIPVVLLARALSVGPPLSLMGLLRPFPPGTTRLLIWGGLRGGISIALALSIPAGPLQTLLLTATYCVVVFSVAVQGTTVGLAARRLLPPEEEAGG